MNDNEKTIALRIKDLEGSAQKARLEAMQLAATLITKQNSHLATRPNSDPSEDIAALKARYDMLVRLADDAQRTLDRLQAEQHEMRYYR